MDKQDTQQWIEQMLEEIEGKVEELRKEAKKIIDEYWTFHLRENEKKSLKNKSILGTRVKVIEGNMAIEWYANRYVLKKDGGWQALSKYLRRGKGNRYSSRTLKQHAKAWEIEFVLEIEDQLGDIREQYSCLSKTRYYLRRWQKALERQAAGAAATALASNGHQ